MKILTQFFSILVLQTLISLNCIAQDALESIKPSNWQLSFSSSIGGSTERDKNGSAYNWGGDSYSFDLGLSRRLKNSFWIQSGVSYNTFRFDSDPFVHSGTSTYYSQGPNGLVPHTYNFVDDFERISRQSSGYLSDPVTLDYMSEKIEG